MFILGFAGFLLLRMGFPWLWGAGPPLVAVRGPLTAVAYLAVEHRLSGAGASVVSALGL